jgi:hypothetical protein
MSRCTTDASADEFKTPTEAQSKAHFHKGIGIKKIRYLCWRKYIPLTNFLLRRLSPFGRVALLLNRHCQKHPNIKWQTEQLADDD